MAERSVSHQDQHQTHQHGRGQLVTEMAKEPSQPFTREQRTDATVWESCTEQPRHQHGEQLQNEQHQGNIWQKPFHSSLLTLHSLHVWFEVIDIEDAQLEGTHHQTGSIDTLTVGEQLAYQLHLALL